MKKFIATFMMLAVMAIGLPIAASAQTYTTRKYVRNGRVYTQRVYKKPSVYQRHRNKINVGIGTGAGALIGGIAGGKKGAVIGALLGAGSGALYTYKINPKKKRKYRRY